MFEFDWERPEELLRRAPRLRWVQATSSGIGPQVDRLGLAGAPLVITNAAGIHAAGRVRRVDAEGLDAALAETNFLVIAVPDTPETRRLVDRRRLELLPTSAVIVNVGRGSIVDEPAMIDLLRSGRLAGAALDVFAREPLPADSPLWAMPNVIVSPHSASTVVEENDRLVDLFVDNLHRYLDGRPLINVYDPRRRY